MESEIEFVKFCFHRPEKSAAGSARGQRELCWTPDAMPICNMRKETAHMKVPVHIARCIISSSFPRVFVCSKWPYNSRQHEPFWLTRPGLLQWPPGLLVSPLRICWTSWLHLDRTTGCDLQLVDMRKSMFGSWCTNESVAPGFHSGCG